MIFAFPEFGNVDNKFFVSSETGQFASQRVFSLFINWFELIFINGI